MSHRFATIFATFDGCVTAGRVLTFLQASETPLLFSNEPAFQLAFPLIVNTFSIHVDLNGMDRE